MQVFAPLLPIFLLVATGAALFKSGFLSPESRRGLERFVYWVALPCLLVVKLAEAPAIGGDALRMGGAVGAGTLGAALLAWAVAAFRGMPGPTAGTFVQAGCRGNLAFTALPVVALASNHDPETNAKAALILGPLVVLFNVISVIALVAPHQRVDFRLPARLAKSIVTNPLIVACALGWAWPNLVGPLPGVAHETLTLLGRTAAPLALLCLGGALVAYRLGSQTRRAAASAVVKLVAAPALAGATAHLLGLRGDDLRTVLVFAAAPTAVASYVLTTQLKGDAPLAAATIALSTALSALSLAAALWITA
ncbi:MAG: AEC family transporter [Planctomycetota bacterium]